ncbi:MAG: HEPN domain-containing protein [Thaumarchaeota archaeon]|nr:HEPN domain-containing protein [Nitrososphaerota archaeon]
MDSKKAINYLIKAENSLRIAKIAIEQQAYDNAVMSSIHSAINALDALTTYRLKKRSSGQHTGVLSLTREIFSAQEQNDVEKQFKLLFGLKNASEYQPEMMSQKDAENSLKLAERILAKVKTKLQKQA